MYEKCTAQKNESSQNKEKVLQYQKCTPKENETQRIFFYYEQIFKMKFFFTNCSSITGHFFHIDFGFIMGADPKPFPPPMKLCKEMVEGMGGRKGSYYHEFRDFCCVVYNLLRRHGEIFTKMLVLMDPANMKDITTYNIEKVLNMPTFFPT